MLDIDMYVFFSPDGLSLYSRVVVWLTFVVPYSPHVFYPLYPIPAADDRHNKEAGPYILFGEHHCIMGGDNGGMFSISRSPSIPDTESINQTLGLGLHKNLEGDAWVSNTLRIAGSRYFTSYEAAKDNHLIFSPSGYFPGCVYLLSSWYVRCE